MPLITLRPGDDRLAPIVCVHPVSGRSRDYQRLADALDWPGAVRGIDARAPAPDSPAAAGALTELASAYCDELDLRTPQLLLGWSIGGVIAAELSRIITARGGVVGFLGILDSRAPQPEMRQRPTDRDALARFFLHQMALTHERDPVAPPAVTTPAALLAALRTLGLADQLPDEAAVEHRLQIFMHLIRAFFHHVQHPLPVALHLFEAADAHPSHPRPASLGWDALAPSLQRHQVAGTHFTLLSADRSPALARAIAACLPRTA